MPQLSWRNEFIHSHTSIHFTTHTVIKWLKIKIGGTRLVFHCCHCHLYFFPSFFFSFYFSAKFFVEHTYTSQIKSPMFCVSTRKYFGWYGIDETKCILFYKCNIHNATVEQNYCDKPNSQVVWIICKSCCSRQHLYFSLTQFILLIKCIEGCLAVSHLMRISHLSNCDFLFIYLFEYVLVHATNWFAPVCNLCLYLSWLNFFPLWRHDDRMTKDLHKS